MTRREAVAVLAKEPQSFDLIWWCIPIGAHEEAMDIVARLSQLATQRKAMGYTRLEFVDNDSKLFATFPMQASSNEGKVGLERKEP